MPRNGPKRSFTARKIQPPDSGDPPIIRGRSLLDGDRLTFPAFFREDVAPVTFRSEDAYRSREEREEYVFVWFERLRKKKRMLMVLIPHDVYANGKHAVFHAGYTLSERDGEIRTRQLVVFLAGDAVPIGRADQGVLCVADIEDLSAWDGRTDEQSRAQAA